MDRAKVREIVGDFLQDALRRVQDGTVTCPACEGRGYDIEVGATQAQMANGVMETSTAPCPLCDGARSADKDAAAKWMLENDDPAPRDPGNVTAAEVAATIAAHPGVSGVNVVANGTTIEVTASIEKPADFIAIEFTTDSADLRDDDQ